MMGASFFYLLCCVGLVLGDPSGCIKMNPCKCLMTDGSGVVNLATLGDSEGFLLRDRKLQRVTEGSQMEEFVTFSPCHFFTEPEASMNCSHVALCIKTRHLLAQKEAPHYLGFGEQGNSDFSYNNATKSLSVTYQDIPSSSLKSVVHFTCSPTNSITFLQDTLSPHILEIVVESPCACPSSCQTEDVGPATIIVIMFAVSTAVYFLFGTCSLRSIQTSEGIRISPEPHIWCWICFIFPKGRSLRKGRTVSHSREAFRV